MLIKEQVHHYILKLYFFVLDAYNHAEHGSFRDASLERTISAKNKANRTVDRSKQKLIAAKDKVGHVGERIKEKAHLTSEGRHSGRENRTEEEMYEERFSEQRAPERTTAIREERITSTGGGPPQRTFRETRQQSGNQTSSRDRLERERTEVSRQGPLERSTAVTTMVRGGAPAAAAVGQLVGTGPLSSGKNLAKVAVWRDRVAEDTAVERALAASEAYRSSLTLEDQKDAARLQNGNHTNAVGKYSRDPSLASGQSYRSSGARSSMLVHPSSSVRERLTGDWAEATRGRLAPGRSEVEMNGGEVARIDRGDKKAWK